jgi:hypothetical protein
LYFDALFDFVVSKSFFCNNKKHVTIGSPYNYITIMPLGVGHGLTSFEFALNGIVTLVSVGSMVSCTLKTLNLKKKNANNNLKLII